MQVLIGYLCENLKWAMIVAKGKASVSYSSFRDATLAKMVL